MARALKIEVGAILIWRYGASLENKMAEVHETGTTRTKLSHACEEAEGYHVYGNSWTPNVGDLPYCINEQESGNPNYAYQERR